MTGGVDKFLTLYTWEDDAAATTAPTQPPVKAATVGGFPGPLLSVDLAPRVVEVEEPAAVTAAVSLGGGRVD